MSYFYQLLLSPCYTVALQATPYRYAFQLFLSTAPSYSYKLLLSVNPMSYSYQQLLSLYYTAAVQATPYRYSIQLFLSVAPSYSYQLLLPVTRSS